MDQAEVRRSQYLAQILAQGNQQPMTSPAQVGMGLGAQALGQMGPGGLRKSLGGMFALGQEAQKPLSAMHLHGMMGGG